MFSPLKTTGLPLCIDIMLAPGRATICAALRSRKVGVQPRTVSAQPLMMAAFRETRWTRGLRYTEKAETNTIPVRIAGTVASNLPPRLPRETTRRDDSGILLDHVEPDQRGGILEVRAIIAKGGTAVYAVLVRKDILLDLWGVN